MYLAKIEGKGVSACKKAEKIVTALEHIFTGYGEDISFDITVYPTEQYVIVSLYGVNASSLFFTVLQCIHMYVVAKKWDSVYAYVLLTETWAPLTY